jgi:hypothetical protein
MQYRWGVGKLIRTFKTYIHIYFIDSIKCYLVKKTKLNESSQINLIDNVLVNTSYHWSHSWIEYLMLSRVRNKANLVALVCDGLPYCEAETLTVNRPTCSACFKSTTQKLHAFDIPYKKISSLIDASEKRVITQSIDKFDLFQEKNYKIDDIDLFKFAKANFYHYKKGAVEITQDLILFKRILSSAMIIYLTTKKLKSDTHSSLLVTTNGKFIQSGISIDLFKKEGLNYITWDAFSQGDKVILGRNTIAHDQVIRKDFFDTLPNLTGFEKKSVDEYFNLQSKSENMPYKLYTDTTAKDIAELSTVIRKVDGKKLIIFYTNVEWDSTAIGFDIAFGSMRDSLKYLIDFLRLNREFHMIIRAHPGESKVPYHVKTQNSIRNFIDQYLTNDDCNIQIIDSSSNIKSYDLAKYADFNIVYTSTFGLELSMLGIRPIVIAKAYYGGFGFTEDIFSSTQLKSCLLGEFINKLDKNQIDLAKKIAYYARFVRLFNVRCMSKGKFDALEYSAKPNDDVIVKLGYFLNNQINEFEISN